MYKLHAQLTADTIYLGRFELCDALLMNDCQYPWVILVPRRAAISEIYELDQHDQLRLMQESRAVSEFMMRAFDGDKFNLAALGNLVPQLHIHHVVRRHGDAAWPNPVWGAAAPINYPTERLHATRQLLQDGFTKLDIGFTSC